MPVETIIRSIPEAHLEISKIVAGVQGKTINPCSVIEEGNLCKFASLKGCLPPKKEEKDLIFEPSDGTVLCARTRTALATQDVSLEI
jgi:hypothetical protein